MTINYRKYQMNGALPARQQGALTMFSAVLILILLTGMVIYAAQVGVFEQRKSGNELRQKQAFHAAEVGIQRGQEFLIANVLDLTSVNATFGWLAAGSSNRWVECSSVDITSVTPAVPYDGFHPCYGEALNGNSGEPNLREASYFYSEDGANPTPIPIPIADNQDLMDRATEAAQVFALLCMLEVDAGLPQPVIGCLPESRRAEFDAVYFVITLLARGRSECDGNGNCRGEALVAQRLGSYGPVPGAGGPGVPLTSKTSLNPTGTVEIVPNPNGGGIGVPVSVWVDGEYPGGDRTQPAIANCPPDAGEVAIDPQSNSWATCEAHEWYETDIMPADFSCPPGNEPCRCDSDEKLISYGNQGTVRFDLIADDEFPCNLFEYLFEETNVDLVKTRFTVIDSCDSLGPTSRGPIWVTSGDDCKITAGRIIGSPTDPVFLVSSTPEMELGGGVQVYGVVMTTDAEDYAGGFDASGGGRVYGAVIVDGQLEPNYGSNFQIVWNDELVRLATKRGSLGKLYGGWTDFHEEWR